MRGDIGFDKLEGGPGAQDIASFATASEAVTADLEGRQRDGDGHDTIGPGTEDLIGSAYPDIADRRLGPEPDRRWRRLRRPRRPRRRRRAARRAGRRRLQRRSADRTPAGHEPTAGAGTGVVRSRSLDGGATLSVRGGRGRKRDPVALGGGDFVVSDSERADPCRPT